MQLIFIPVYEQVIIDAASYVTYCNRLLYLYIISTQNFLCSNSRVQFMLYTMRAMQSCS